MTKRRGIRYNRPVEQRFWDKVDKSGGPDACWLWAAAIDPTTGYGAFRVEGKTVGAHRWLMEHLQGESIPRHVDACHTCDVRACVNPRHLFLGTRDGQRPGHARQGPRSPSAAH